MAQHRRRDSARIFTRRAALARLGDRVNPALNIAQLQAVEPL
jgi:hypothetical protein